LSFPSGAKARDFYAPSAARLKPCPDTKQVYETRSRKPQTLCSMPISNFRKNTPSEKIRHQEKYAIKLLTAPGENQFAYAIFGDGTEGADFYLSSSNL
jgi:hypothetical protein